MDVGIVTPGYPPEISGGGEISAQLLANEMVKHDSSVSVNVFTFGSKSSQIIDGVSVNRLGSLPNPPELANPAAYSRLRRAIEESGVDVLHAYNMNLHPATGILSHDLNIPSISTLNSYYFLPKSEIVPQKENLIKRIRTHSTFRILRHCLTYFDIHIGLSDSIRQIYASNGLDFDESVTIPNMIDPQFRVPDCKSSTDKIDLLYVGSLGAHKGVDYLIRSLTELPNQYQLTLAGPNPRREELDQLISRVGVSDRIRLTGKIPYEQITQLYAESDIFVHPGVWPEPFGRTLLEAMQAGLPIVCTNIGAPPEIVPEGNEICDPATYVGLAEKIHRVGNSKDNVGERNRKYVLSQYSPDKVLRQILSTYQRAIQK